MGENLMFGLNCSQVDPVEQKQSTKIMEEKL